jgi:hypothetical protein
MRALVSTFGTLILGTCLTAACSLPIPAGLPLSDTEVIPVPAATATATVMLERRGSYVDPKLIGPEFRLDKVNQINDCAPEGGKSLPDNCKGKWWRSFGVISRSRNGTYVSQSITQHDKQARMSEELANDIRTIKELNNRKSYSEEKSNIQSVEATVLSEEDQDKLYVITTKMEYIAQVIVWGKKDSMQQAQELATRVLIMLLDRIPNKLGGEVPNADYLGNRYWEIR